MKFKELREKYRSKFKPAEITKAVDIALSMGGNMTGAYKKIEAFKKGLANDPMVKQALRLANESVNEEVETVLEKAYDSKDVKKVQQLEKKLQGMLKEVEKTMKGSGLSAPAFNNVRSGIVKGLQSIQKFYKIAGNTKESVNEAYSKNLTDKDVDAQFKSMRDPESFYGNLDTARADMKKDYSPKNSARPKVWTSLRYPVRDGDYYFAFIDNNEKKNMKYNEKMNDALKAAKVGGDKKSVDDMWLVVSRELKTYPKSLGWNDTMTREELYGAIQHMLGKISESNITEKSFKTKAGLMVGKRQKAPRYESTTKRLRESLSKNTIKENVKAVMRKHKKHIDKWKRSNKPMPIQVEDELMQAAMKAGEIKTDDPEEFDNWLDSNL